jgi:hypothetical protein
VAFGWKYPPVSWHSHEMWFVSTACSASRNTFLNGSNGPYLFDSTACKAFLNASDGVVFFFVFA